MKLNVYERPGEKKSDLTRMRYMKDIPAVVYRPRQSSEKILIKGEEFATIIRNLKKGHLPTTIFEMNLWGKQYRTAIKEIQYHPTTYDILHLDFQVLEDKIPINIKVPVIFSGITECVGVKLGGFVRQIIYHVKVRCLPKDIPANFVLNVSKLSIGELLRINDIDKSDAIQLLVPQKEIVVVIAKR